MLLLLLSTALHHSASPPLPSLVVVPNTVRPAKVAPLFRRACLAALSHLRTAAPVSPPFRISAPHSSIRPAPLSPGSAAVSRVQQTTLVELIHHEGYDDADAKFDNYDIDIY